MSFTYNKRMSNYQSMLPLTPHNYRLAQHTIRGGDLTVQTTAPVPLPETINDWLNMNDDDLHKLTPVDINSLSIASFKLAFGGTKPFGNLIAHRLFTNNPNSQVMLTAVNNRRNIIRGGVRGGDLTTTSAIPALPETVQDWQNMSTAELQELTPADISNLSDASFAAAFNSTAPLGNSILHVVEGTWGANTPSQALMVTAINNHRNSLAFWVSPNDPKLKAQLEGVPSFWLQHPNQYTHAKSQNVMYGAYQDFQDTSFYTKYSSRLKAITPPRKFARYMNSEIPGNERNSMGSGSSQDYLDDIIGQYGQKWRVLFFQGDLSGVMQFGNDYYVYYIDSTGLPDYLDMLNEFYNDRDTMQPQEVIIMLNARYRAAVREHEAALVAQGYSEGEAAQKAEDAAAAETSEDSSSDVWGDIKDGLEIGEMFL